MSARLRNHVSLTRTSDGLVLLNRKSGRYWQLNESGALVLEMLLSGATAARAAATLATRYSVSPERARDDVGALLAALRAGRLLA